MGHKVWAEINFAPEFYQMCAFLFTDIKTLSINGLESPHFSQNVVNEDFEQRDNHGQLINSHVKVMENSSNKV